jgi:hypothetical protein
MRRITSILVGLSLLPLSLAPCSVAAKNIQQTQETNVCVTNADVQSMIKNGIAEQIIVAKLKTSTCTCDTSLPELQRLKAAGVSDAVLVAMISAGKVIVSEPIVIKIPAGTAIDIETAYRFSSQEIKKGEAVSFRVVNPIKIEDMMVIEPGATATARVVLSKRGGHFGRAGRIAWTMETVAAVDGSLVPIQAAARVVGDSKGASTATKMIVTGALLGPFAPLALMYGFKRGGDAYIPEGRRFVVVVSSDTTIKAHVTRR